MFPEPYKNLEDFTEKNTPFNSYRIAAVICERAQDYLNASYWYTKCGELYKSFEMSKLAKIKAQNDKIDNDLSAKFMEKVRNSK